MNNQRLAIIVLILAGLAALAAGVGSYIAQQSARQADVPAGLLWPSPQLFPDVTLYDHNGNDFSRAQLEGQWSLVFFGFTHCPDICPNTMATLERLQRRLSQQGIDEEELQIIFISVDPKRDNPQRLASYVTYFDENFIGASGDKETIDQLTRSVGAVYHIGGADEQDNYQVDHSASIFLFSPRARLVSIYTTPHEAEPMSERFMAIRDFIQQRQ